MSATRRPLTRSGWSFVRSSPGRTTLRRKRAAGNRPAPRLAANSDAAMTKSPSATAVSKLVRGGERTPSPCSEVTSGRLALRQALTAAQAAQRERACTRSTRSEAMMR